MNFIHDEKAQAGGIILLVVGLLFCGVLYVGFSMIMDSIQTANNAIISDPNMEYSQDHWNAMDLLFKYWWGIPIFTLILFSLNGIINALKKQETQV